MSITVVCPQCGKSYDLPDNRAGQTGKCACGASMTIPSSESQSESSANQSTFSPRVEPSSSYQPQPVQNPYGSSPGQGSYAHPYAVGNPSNSAAMTRPIALTLIIVWIDLANLFLLGMGGFIFLMDPEDLTANVIFFLAMAVVILVISHFLWLGRSWARFTMIVLMSLSVLINLLALIIGVEGIQQFVCISQIPTAALFVYILNTNATREYCRK